MPLDDEFRRRWHEDQVKWCKERDARESAERDRELADYYAWRLKEDARRQAMSAYYCQNPD